jgi:Coenzyme PQQ synthesis protein D (PqqD)
LIAYVLPKGVLRASLEDEEVLLNPATGMYHLLNRTGKQLVESMARGDSFDAAVEGIAHSTGEDLLRVRADADEWVRRMADRGLIEKVER